MVFLTHGLHSRSVGTPRHRAQTAVMRWLPRKTELLSVIILLYVDFILILWWTLLCRYRGPSRN